MKVINRHRQMGFKLTPQRIAVLNYLRGNKAHPSVEDIYLSVSKQFPTMSLATVYNILETLKKKGGVRELTIDPDKKRYCPVNTPHHHLMCTKCKAIIDVNKVFNLALSKSYTKGFVMTGSQVEFYGTCKKCRK